MILAGLALAIPDLAAAAFQRVYIDGILIEGHLDWLRPLLIAVGATALMRLAAAGLQQVYLTRLEIRLTLAESLGFLRHALQLPVVFFQRRFTGDIVTGPAQTARVAGLISGELATTAVSLLTLVVYVAVMLRYDPTLTVMGVAISGFNLVALRMVEPVPRRPEPGHRAAPRPAHGGRDVGDPDHREHQGDRVASRTCWSDGPATRRG